MKTEAKIHKFVQIPNTLLEAGLSAEAIGLFCYMAAKPKNWRYRREQICSEANIPLARFKRAMAELEASGYVLKVSVYDRQQKKLAGKDYILAPDQDLPDCKMVFADILPSGAYASTPTLDFDAKLPIMTKTALTDDLTEGAIYRPSVKQKGRQTEASVTEASVTEASVLGGAYIRLDSSLDYKGKKTLETLEAEGAILRPSVNPTLGENQPKKTDYQDSDPEVLTDPDFVRKFTIPRLRSDFNAHTFLHPEWSDDKIAETLQACASYYLATGANYRNWIEKAKYWMKSQKDRHTPTQTQKPPVNLDNWTK